MMRRGELLALRWDDLNLDEATVSVERSLEETKAGLRFKTPKTKHGRRVISLPPSSVEVLRAHRRRQLELRIALGQGRQEPTALVFSNLEGGPLSPDNLSREWRRVAAARKLPRVFKNTWPSSEMRHDGRCILRPLIPVSFGRPVSQHIRSRADRLGVERCVARTAKAKARKRQA